MNTYSLQSIKGTRTVTGTLARAICDAGKMDEELQPAWGVAVWLTHQAGTELGIPEHIGTYDGSWSDDDCRNEFEGA